MEARAFMANMIQSELEDAVGTAHVSVNADSPAAIIRLRHPKFEFHP